MRVLTIGWGQLCARCENDFTPLIDPNQRKCVFDNWCDECYCEASIFEKHQPATPEQVAEMLKKNEETRQRLRAQKEAKKGIGKEPKKRRVKKINYQFVEELTELTEREKEIAEAVELQRQQLEDIFYYSDD